MTEKPTLSSLSCSKKRKHSRKRKILASKQFRGSFSRNPQLKHLCSLRWGRRLERAFYKTKQPRCSKKKTSSTCGTCSKSTSLSRTTARSALITTNLYMSRPCFPQNAANFSQAAPFWNLSGTNLAESKLCRFSTTWCEKWTFSRRESKFLFTTRPATAIWKKKTLKTTFLSLCPRFRNLSNSQSLSTRSTWSPPSANSSSF